MLEKYNGMSQKHICPQCNRRSLVYYLDRDGKMIDECVGRCDHQSSCGYDFKPADYYNQHPERKPKADGSQKTYQKPTPKPLCLLPFDYVSRSRCNNNTLLHFLTTIFDEGAVRDVAEKYLIGSTKDQRIIYWQIDRANNVHTGKIIRYNQTTGHRVKDVAGSINWTHSLLKKAGKLPEDWQLTQCLFGEHLVKAGDNRVVALVEAEKTAVIGAILFPQYIWLATGGIENLKQETMSSLSGKTVLLFPDIDGFEKWSNKAKQIKGCRLIVSNIFSGDLVTDEDRRNKIDIADWMVSDAIKRKELQEHFSNNLALQTLAQRNPNILALMKVLQLQVVS